MIKIPVMDATDLVKKYVRTTDRIRGGLKRLVLDLSEAPAFARRRRMLSEEAVINASWLWMRAQDPAELAETLRPYVEQAEALLRESESPASPAAGEPPLPLPPAAVVNPRPRGARKGAG